MTKTALCVLAAADRHNYGDLLFPLLVEQAARELGVACPIATYATRRSDLSEYGALPTASLRELLIRSRLESIALVVAGGEVLPARWHEIAAYASTDRLSRLFHRLPSVLGDRLASQIAARLHGARSRLPFAFSSDEVGSDTFVAYNAVGASHLSDCGDAQRTALQGALVRSNYLSVRDLSSAREVELIGGRAVTVTPDCAVLVSKYFALPDLERLISIETRHLVNRLRRGGYVCCQAAYSHFQSAPGNATRGIGDLAAAVGLPVVMLSIGLAPGHEDQRTIAQLRKALPQNRFEIMRSAAIWDTMWLIANSALYCGTSLHGAITACVHSVPMVLLCPSRVRKALSFLQSWADFSNFDSSEFDTLPAIAAKVIATPLDAKRSAAGTAKLQAMAMDNFRAMFAEAGLI